jgi:hypothetical protein
MTYSQAVSKAKRLSVANGQDYFVLNQYEEFNDSRYQVASEFDLETFWLGISESRILYCTGEVE